MITQTTGLTMSASVWRGPFSPLLPCLFASCRSRARRRLRRGSLERSCSRETPLAVESHGRTIVSTDVPDGVSGDLTRSTPSLTFQTTDDV